jgi:hypothetical protein
LSIRNYSRMILKDEVKVYEEVPQV